jgi:hypothetical protein
MGKRKDDSRALAGRITFPIGTKLQPGPKSVNFAVPVLVADIALDKDHTATLYIGLADAEELGLLKK